ncbi:cathepsin L-like proteinase [Euwallacea similis]|uniref:cathepsin L-like proteinase n=1 Tax=Euwallacea similis TaxID=1736056 RepID=UPI00344ED866
MKKFILTCLVVVTVSASLLEEHQALFETFKSAHGKTYSRQEDARRFAIFRDNLRSIEQHNALYAKGLVSYNKTVTMFSDWTPEEFRSYLTLHSKPARSLKTIPFVKTRVAIPASRDWRTEGYVTDIKNQGSSGYSWVFSVTGSTEGAYFKSSGKLVSLSEQQLADCSCGNDGCNGEPLDGAFAYVEEYGLESEADYPITSEGICRYDASKVVTKISKYVSISEDEENLLEAVGTIGPVSVVVDASYLANYAAGIYSDSNCSPNNLNHAVLIVGYGSEDGQDYWIVKNTWGTSWGEQGYFRILRGADECGIAEDTVYPVV